MSVSDNNSLAEVFENGKTMSPGIVDAANAKLQQFRERKASHSTTSRAVERPQPPSFQVLGIRVHAVQMSEAVEQLRSLIDSSQSTTRYVSVLAMHVVAASRQNDHFRLVLNSADLVVPDGMPLVWLGRIQGFALRHRVCGAELMDRFCQETGAAYRHFFFGGTPGVAEKLATSLREKHGIVVAGTFTPPFRPLTNAEEEELALLVEEASPDVLWVGLSSPKQENWIYEHRHKLRVPVMLPVGGAFDMNSGTLRRAPEWMRENGLEWLFRLCSEPRRLWRRYLVTIPQAMWFVGLELLRFPNLRSAVRSTGSSAAEKSTEDLSKS